jgi:His-Xaa-Ser system protein HxsD
MTIRLPLDRSAYSLEAAQKAAYRFIDRLTVVLSQDDTHVLCDIDAIPRFQSQLDRVLADFKRELLDQQLRCQIKAETEGVRNLIMAYAFSRSGLQA